MTFTTIVNHTTQASIPRFGVSIKKNRGNNPAYPVTYDQNIAMAEEIGATVLRIDVMWADVEQQAGVYNWTDVLNFVNKCRAKNILPHLIFARGNPLYTASWQAPALTPAAQDAYAAAFTAMVQAVGSAFYEVMNEPNNPEMFGAAPDPVAFGKLVNKVLVSVYAVRPQTAIIAGGLAIGGDGFMAPADFLAAAAPHVTATNLRAWGIHPYTGADKFPNDPMLKPERVQDRMLGFRPAGMTTMVWNTEQGDSAVDCTGATLAEKRERQADHMVRAMLSGMLCWGEFVIYDMVDDYNDPASVEGNFGFFDFYMVAKPAAKKAKVVGNLIKTCTSAIVQKDGDAYRTIFQLAGKPPVTILWGSAGAIDVPQSVSHLTSPVQISSL